MRQKNLRVVFTGTGLIVLAGLFFIGMAVMLAPKSNDPVEMMRTVGQVFGACVGIGFVMIVFGLIGRKR